MSFSAQECKKDFEAFFEKQTQEFLSVEKSPLTESDRTIFESLDYFDYQEDYCVQATFVHTPNEEPFEMETSTDRRPVYVKFGELHFELNGTKLKLALYQNPELIKNEEYADYLFLPFGDASNGLETYGAGRFIDFRIPDTDIVNLDFNQSYNPLCAYNHDYSCPKPPQENMLKVSINAGVKGVNLKE